MCRNGLMPKKLHLEIALGNIFPKEGVYIFFPFSKLGGVLLLLILLFVIIISI